MMWTFVRSVVHYLSRDFRSALLEYQKEIEGKKAAQTRWLSCLEDINSYSHGLTFALGYMWVSKAFDSDVIPLVSEKLYIHFLMRLILLIKIAGQKRKGRVLSLEPYLIFTLFPLFILDRGTSIPDSTRKTHCG